MAPRSPQEVDALFQEHMRRGELDAVLELYEPDVSFRNAEGEVKQGRAALREELLPFATAKTNFEFDIRGVVLAGDLALVHNQWHLTSPHEASGYAIEVMRRQADGTWRFAIGDPFTIKGTARQVATR